MLKQSVINEAILSYLNKQVPKQSTYDLKKISGEVMNVIRKTIDLDNATKQHEKWKIPERLGFTELALIINHLYIVRKISFLQNPIDEDDDILGIYIEEGNKLGTYAIDDSWLKETVYELASYNITKKEFTEVKAVLMTLAKHVEITRDKNLIAVNNGIYNRETKTLEDFTPEYVFLTKSPIDYNPKAKNVVIKNPDGTNWDIESWIEELSEDHEIKELLWQIIAASIRPNHGWTKAIWLYSQKGNNGKGTYCELLRNISGKGNWVSLQVSEFSKDFALGGLLQASVVITDENDVGTYIDDVANYKAAVTGDSFMINQKYKNPITASFSGLIVQCMNGFPKTRDKTGSFYRRLLMIPFNKSFTGIEKPYIKKDYLKRTEVLEYVLYKILHMEFNEFIEPVMCKKIIYEYEEYNDTTVQFWHEMRDEFVWDCLPSQFLYDLYVAWQKRNAPHGKPVNKLTFMKELENIIDKDPDWIYKANQEDKIKVGDKMDKPEFLILEYNLTKWMKEDYTGTMPEKRVSFNKKQSYRGIQRVKAKDGI